MATWREIFGFMHGRKQAYMQTFQTNQPANVLVLADLQRFCRANETTFNPDARIAANLDGRREVWLRIQNHLNLNEEQLAELYAGNLAAVARSEDQ